MYPLKQAVCQALYSSIQVLDSTQGAKRLQISRAILIPVSFCQNALNFLAHSVEITLMKTTLLHGRTFGAQEDLNALIRPHPIITFTKIYAESKAYQPQFGDRDSLLILKRVMPKKVSFIRAYRGFRASGAKEISELGEGRAFFRWMQKHELSILWKEEDFNPHPYFAHKDAPKHALDDEMARGLSFAIRPVQVANRKVKLYVRDNDMLSLLNLPYGEEEDFLELVMSYVAQRFSWEEWRAPAPPFIDWVVSHGKRPIFGPGQMGFDLSAI